MPPLFGQYFETYSTMVLTPALNNFPLQQSADHNETSQSPITTRRKKDDDKAEQHQQQQRANLTEESESSNGDTISNSTCDRVVRFQETVSIRHVPRIEDMSADEIEDTWYDLTEYDLFKEMNRVIVRMMKSDKYKECADYSFRGLEFRSKDGLKTRKELKAQVLKNLLEEQQRQKDQGIIDGEMLAETMRLCTWGCQQEAIEFAKKDEEFVLQGCEFEQDVGSLLVQTRSSSNSISSGRDLEEESVASTHSKPRTSKKAKTYWKRPRKASKRPTL